MAARGCRLEPSLGKSKNSLGNTWIVLGVYIVQGGAVSQR